MTKINNMYMSVIGAISLCLWGLPKAAQGAVDQTFKHKYNDTIRSIMWAANKAEIPSDILLAVCWTESSFKTDGVTRMDGPSLSYGICQVKLETALFMDLVYRHKIKATPSRLENKRLNAFYAAKYLKYQLRRYNQNWKLAVDGYNKGSAVNTQSEYVKKFMLSYEHMQKNIVFDTVVMVTSDSTR